MDSFDIVKLPPCAESARMFYGAVKTAKEASDKPYLLNLKKPEEYIGQRLFFVQDGKATVGGAMVMNDGLIANVFKFPDTPKGFLTLIMPTLLKSGGTHLVCTGEILMNKYAQFGFAVVSSMDYEYNGQKLKKFYMTREGLLKTKDHSLQPVK